MKRPLRFTLHRKTIFSAASLLLAAGIMVSSGCGRAVSENTSATAAEASIPGASLSDGLYENTHSSNLLPSSAAESSLPESSLSESPAPVEDESTAPEGEESSSPTVESSLPEVSETSAVEMSEPSQPESSAEPSQTTDPAPAAEPSHSQEQSLVEEPSGQSEPEPSENGHVHQFGSYIVTEQVTCTKAGAMTAVCECGEISEKAISPLGHDYEITRKTDSQLVRTCKRCGNVITEKVTPVRIKDISELSVQFQNEHIYDGNEFRPAVTVYDGDKDVSYSCGVVYAKNAVEVGAYTLTVNMNGTYSGSRSFQYKIFPAKPGLEQQSFTDTACTVVWKNDGHADGYVLQYSPNPDFSGDVQQVELDGSAGSYQVTGLSKEAAVYIRLRSYNLVETPEGEFYYNSFFSDPLKAGGPRMEVINGVTYVDGILIANKTYALPSSYNPGLLPETQKAVDEMAAAAAKDGISLYIVSGFRSYSTQVYTYNYFVGIYGQARADRSSARPGHSEHQSGLAVDLNSTYSSFAGTPEAIWIANNCWKYGFIVRYPQDKEAITGYMYEPWHVRYLGKDLAKKVTESGLCLEEYLNITSAYQN